MPYAPTVNDNSGQILAQGINQGIAGLADGIQRSIAERKKKEEERRAKEAVNAAGKGLFGEDFDVKDAKPDQYGMIIQLAQQKKEEPMRAVEQRFKQAQIDNFALQAQLQQSESARRQSDDAAMRAVYGSQGSGGPSVSLTENQRGMMNLPAEQGGPTATDANDLFATAARNGMSAAGLASLAGIDAQRASAAENRAQALSRAMPKPEKSISYLNPPQGAQWMKDENGNLHNLTPKPDPKARREFEVGGRKMVEEGGKVFDGKTGELVGPAKPLDPDTQSRLATRLSAAQTEAEKSKGMFESAADYAKRVRDARMKANLAASTLGYAPPYEDALTPQGKVATPKPAGSRFKIVPEPSK
jgi:hypothetical protein